MGKINETQAQWRQAKREGLKEKGGNAERTSGCGAFWDQQPLKKCIFLTTVLSSVALLLWDDCEVRLLLGMMPMFAWDITETSHHQSGS